MKAQDKPRLFVMMKLQFPNALCAVADRCHLGHAKYKDLDQDYQGFTRLPVDEYDNAIVRHILEIGEPGETKIDHLAATAWNALARLEMELRNQMKHDEGNNGI